MKTSRGEYRSNYFCCRISLKKVNWWNLCDLDGELNVIPIFKLSFSLHSLNCNGFEMPIYVEILMEFHVKFYVFSGFFHPVAVKCDRLTTWMCLLRYSWEFRYEVSQRFVLILLYCHISFHFSFSLADLSREHFRSGSRRFEGEKNSWSHEKGKKRKGKKK